MKVIKLFTKQSNRQIVECHSLNLLRGYGIEGDSNACAGSPRQLLLVDQPTLKQFDLQPGDLSENILVDTSLQSLESGTVLRVGNALVRLTFLCEPCSKLESLRQGLAKAIKGRRGILGMVVKSGVVTVEDAIAPTPYTLPALSEDVKSRFQEFVARIPAGKVVTTVDLLLALGVANAYYRVIPIFIKNAPASLPLHRIVSVDGKLLTPHIPDQLQKLVWEGVKVEPERMDASPIRASDIDTERSLNPAKHTDWFIRYRWAPEQFHDLGNFL
ncbi:MOSC domain-containing protein [Leptothermofonsia sp. ETS-13]|uniref:MOSC domain-containing protein n=1 Tax=Leptothermofonsia sp. ETS-13 TaxID=3035696 RepID=UPI003B9EE9F2